MSFGGEGIDEPVAHGLIADVGRLFKGDVADAGKHDQLRQLESTLQLARGAQADSTIAVSPDQQGWFSGKPRERVAEEAHIHEPALDDLYHVIDGAGYIETLGISVERIRGHSGGIAIHAAERSSFQHPGEERDATGEPDSKARLVEAEELVSEIAERICRGKEDETANAGGMTSGKHHGHGATMGMCGDIGLVEAEGVHERR